ncbi:MAG: NADH-quinone oxidoreductase subunit NuoE [Microlunatus sp.]|nr:NADH-quinone oxidoreductase subunit NuoE [Microlunatus sp.]
MSTHSPSTSSGAGDDRRIADGRFGQVPPGVNAIDPNAHRPEPIDTTVTETAIDEKTLDELRQIAARYPQSRSAIQPMLHLVQSVENRVTPAGIEAIAEILDISTADVSGVATFYTMYKRRPNGEYNVGVCGTALCAIMGGDDIYDRLSKELGIGHDETTPDGKITLEKVECNAACDYAPVVMINWEFMDNQSPESALETVTKLRHGVEVTSTRGARICTWKQAERVLAGYSDDRADEGPTSGPASQLGIRLAAENNWRAPTPEEAAAALAAAREAEGESTQGQEGSK